MDTPLYIFEADRSKEMLQLTIAIIATASMIFAFIRLKRKEFSYEKRNLQKTVLMLLGFGLITSIGSIFGIGFRLNQLQDVEVYKDRVITGYGEVSYEELKTVYLHTGHQSSIVSPDIKLDTTRLAYFEEFRGRSYVFSESHYEVKKIVRAVRPILDSLNQQ
ncbi:MAG: hypothetical protein AAGG68_21105 [Bacteroidota bacterium]